MSWLDRFRPPEVPAAISAMFGRDEHVLALAPLVAGGTAVVTRFGIYLLAAGSANDGERSEGAERAEGAETAEGTRTAKVERIPWHLVSKARLDAGTLRLIVADEVGTLPSGAVLVRDRPPIDVRPERRNKLTDVVHARVRGSVIGSRRLAVEGVTGWLALRSVAGRDGLMVQFRLDPGSADPWVGDPRARDLGPRGAGVPGCADLDREIAAAAERLKVASGRGSIDD